MAIDLTVVIVCLILITCFGLWVGRNAGKDSSSYFLGGRSFNWVIIGFSLFAHFPEGIYSTVPELNYMLPEFARERHFYELYSLLVLFLTVILFTVSYLTRATSCRETCVPGRN